MSVGLQASMDGTSVNLLANGVPIINITSTQTKIIKSGNPTIPSFVINSNTSTGLFKTQDNKLGISVNGSKVAEFGSDEITINGKAKLNNSLNILMPGDLTFPTVGDIWYNANLNSFRTALKLDPNGNLVIGTLKINFN